MLRRVGLALGLRQFVEVTVEDDGHLDISDFQASRDAGILLDGVGDAQTLVDSREVLQGRPKECKGGRAATMKFSYPFTFARRAIVATFDLSAHNLDFFKEHHWLSNPRNVIVLRLSGPAWQGAAVAVPRAVLSRPEDQVASWDVKAVASWMEARDAHGIAAVFRANGMCGPTS